MTLKNREFLREYIRVLNDVCSYADAARVLKMDQSTIFVWLRQSKAAAEAKENPSPWLISVDGEERYFHQHCRRAGDNTTEHIEANAKKRARDGFWVPSMFQGRRVPARDPKLIGRQWLIDMLGLDDDLLRDKAGNVIFEMQYVPPATDLAMGLLAANSKKYRKQSSVDVNMRGGGVVVVPMRAEPAKVAAPLPILEIVQSVTDEEPAADFAELEEAEDIDLKVTDTPPDAPPVAPVDEPATPRAPTPPTTGPRISTPTPPEYAGAGPNAMIKPRGGRPLSDLERDLLSKLPSDNSAVRAALKGAPK
jgi:hypothetical protein